MPEKPAKCSDCKNELTRVLVYLNGRWSRRVAVLQCPNHCDLQCPQCGGNLRATKRNKKEMSIHCRNCGWKGHSPDREFMTKQKDHQAKLIAAREKARAEVKEKNAFERRQREWRTRVPAGGVPCHECGEPLLEQMFDRKILSQSLAVWKIRILCSRKGCVFKKIVHQYEGEPTREEQVLFRMNSYERHPYSYICVACGQMPRTGGRCGCS